MWSGTREWRLNEPYVRSPDRPPGRNESRFPAAMGAHPAAIMPPWVAMLTWTARMRGPYEGGAPFVRFKREIKGRNSALLAARYPDAYQAGPGN